MTSTTDRGLDDEALALFARKGCEGGTGVPQAGEANAVKVRRVMQLTQDLTGRPFESLRILDLGCGEGVYAIEAALHGAQVVALDARTQRMDAGAACAARHGLERVRFVQADVRGVTRASFGAFDVVWLLGLLYHLDVPDAFSVLSRVHALCERLLVVDTFVSLTPGAEARWGDGVYHGERLREHADNDPPEVRAARVLRSVDNAWSFRFTREALVRLLRDVGFPSVLECHVPLEPHKPADRITLAALQGTPARVAAYPWINDLSDAEIERRLAARNDAPGEST